VVCAADDELVEDDEADDDERVEYDVAALDTSSSRSLDDAFVAVDEPDDVAAAVELEPGAWAANQAPRPRNDAALTAPVMRRARRAGCGFFAVVMVGACARPGKTS
jgi:hypothetical protein